MEIFGDPLFAKDANGKLKSRIGTLFFRTPALVTVRGVHAMQRLAWLGELDARRAAAGAAPLSETEKEAELEDSADLLFTDDLVLIRPDPNRMDLALKADEILQTLVPKSRIRFLNTHAAKVRDALRARGENWRMARRPLSPEEVNAQIAAAKTAIDLEPVYYYNGSTGTRFLTAATFAAVVALSPERLRAQLVEIAKGMKGVNRLGQPEISLFPSALPLELKAKFAELKPETLDDAALAKAASSLLRDYRLALPAELRDESTGNFEWRNEMSAALTREPNETVAGDEDLIQGISPEFFRQIEWLPGGAIRAGELVFDSVFDEAERTGDPALLDLCDGRVRSIVFNLMRYSGSVEYVNVGRIARSLARHPVPGSRRGKVYLIQFRERGEDERVFIVRFQKWGVAEHLDEGKDMLRAIFEADEYSEYILDRRLACRQLGMNLPHHYATNRLTETYRGRNQHNGCAIRTFYSIRAYIPGTASDKVPPARFANPAYARRFAELMGEAAAVDLVVSREDSVSGVNLFDQNYEIIVSKPGSPLPDAVVVTDHAGSFVGYKKPYEELLPPYANVAKRRLRFVKDPQAFVEAYVTAFGRRLAEIQARYRASKRAFDLLFAHRPYDTAGSSAFRWHCILRRLDACDPQALAARLRACCSPE